VDARTEYLSCADTARLLRKALKRTFSGVRFSVRSDTYGHIQPSALDSAAAAIEAAFACSTSSTTAPTVGLVD
jgi:hypothetical protein